MRELVIAIIALLGAVFMVSVGFLGLSLLWGSLDYALAHVAQHIPPDPSFAKWYQWVRDNAPTIAAAALLCTVVACFVYLIVEAQRRRTYEYGVV